MKILLSIPVHECRRVIEDQLRNFQFFLEDVTVVFHLSQSYTEDPDFSSFPNVHVNPKRYPTRWGNIAYLHYANTKYAFEKNLDFDYVLFCSSNELYFRKGVEKLLAQAKVFMDPRGIINKKGVFTFSHPRKGFYRRTGMDDCAVNDPQLWAFIDKHKLPGICKSQVEGSAYHRSVMKQMLTLINTHFSFKYIQDALYCAEEIFFPTIALAVVKKEKIRTKRQFSFMDLCHDYTQGLWIKSIKYWRGDNRSKRLQKYFKNIDAQDTVFAIKGVKRTYYNRVRRYIRGLTPCVQLPLRTKLSYCWADTKYNLNIMKGALRPRRLALTIPHWILGVVSRLIGKPKGYLQTALRDHTVRIIKKFNLGIG